MIEDEYNSSERLNKKGLNTIEIRLFIIWLRII